MRILPSDEQQTRKEKILQAVIHTYIKTGKPVGSSTIVDSYHIQLSPATIRNVLAELEKEGFLTHPHTSAGRVPTDQGYRFYVDSIAKIQKLAEEERMRIEGEYQRRMKEIDGLMKSTTRMLSTLSQCTGFALNPKIDEERLRLVELIPVNSNQILGVLVSESGVVKNQMIRVSAVPSERDLRVASRFLSDHLKGMSFHQAPLKLVEELEQSRNQYGQQLAFLKSLSDNLFEQVPGESALLVEGASNLFNFPEFNDIESIRSFTSLVDKKDVLERVLIKELNSKGLQVRIGEETSPELKNFSVVSSCYQFRGRPVGVLGILGPKRMPYERMMSIVETVADLVNQALEQNDENLLEG